jgi:hypothetical protein
MTICFSATLLLTTCVLITRASRVPNPIAEFPFFRGECLEGSFRDVVLSNSMGGLVRDQSRTGCLMGNGVVASSSADTRSSGLHSLKSISDFIKAFDRNALTVEFWLRGKNANATSSLMSFSTISDGTSYSLRVSQQNLFLHYL